MEPNAGDLSADDWELTEQPETNRKKLRYTVSEYPMLGLATISFQLQLRGWKKLEQSKFWKKASERIAEAQTG